MTAPDYIELRAHSAYSLLRGTSPPETLVAQAANLGLPGLALTDHNNVYGAVGFQKAAQALGIQPILGAELTIEYLPPPPGSHEEGGGTEAGAGGGRGRARQVSPLQSDSNAGVGGRGRGRARKAGGMGCALTLLVAEESGWENLCWLITQAQHQAPKGEGLLRFQQLQGRTAGLIALSGGREGEIARALESEGMSAARRVARRHAALFEPGCFWIELHHHRRPYDEQRIAALVELAESLKLGYAAANHVHYPTPAEKPLGDVLTAIRHNRPLNAVTAHLFPNGQRYLKPAEEMAALFHCYPRALSNTLRIAEACRYQLPSQLQALPQHPTPAGMSAQAYLTALCRRSQRYHPRMEERLQHELRIIETIGARPIISWSSGISPVSPGSAAFAARGAARPPIRWWLICSRSRRLTRSSTGSSSSASCRKSGR